MQPYSRRYKRRGLDYFFYRTEGCEFLEAAELKTKRLNKKRARAEAKRDIQQLSDMKNNDKSNNLPEDSTNSIRSL